MTTGAPPSGKDDPRRARRRAFVMYLYRLHKNLTSKNPREVTESRQVLARLRRSFAGSRQHAEAYDVVFQHDPPEHDEEVEVWVLVAGLFALHPQHRPPSPRGSRRPSLGAPMGRLVQKRGDSANRRFTQLLSVAPDTLPHHLRQAVQLLRADGIPLDYERLIEDLVTLLAEHRNDPVRREEAVHRVRLDWARDFYRQPQTPTSASATDEPAATA